MRVEPEAEAMTVSEGQLWSRTDADDPAGAVGRQDDPVGWRGWVEAVDADTGEVAWWFETPAPVLGAITPVAGGIVLYDTGAGER